MIEYFFISINQSKLFWLQVTETTFKLANKKEEIVPPGLQEELNDQTVGVRPQKNGTGDFSGDPVDKTLHSQCRGLVLILGQGTKIPHTTWHNLKIF